MIRLARRGARKQPHYRIVVIEKERARPRRVLGVEGRADVGPGAQAVLEAGTGSGQRRFRRLEPEILTTAVATVVSWPLLPISLHV
jgi:hypothetical protein